MGNFSFLLWAISFWFRHWKNFKNRPTFAKVTVKIKAAQFFLTHSVFSRFNRPTVYIPSRFCTLLIGTFLLFLTVLNLLLIKLFVSYGMVSLSNNWTFSFPSFSHLSYGMVSLSNNWTFSFPSFNHLSDSLAIFKSRLKSHTSK